MKKLFILFFSVIALYTTPSLCVTQCESNAEFEAYRIWSFDYDTKVNKKYKNKIQEIINSPVEEKKSGTCIPKGPYTCNAGDILSKCCPCAEFWAKRIVEKLFIQDYINEKCQKTYTGIITEQNTPESYTNKNCEYQILQDANDAVSGTIQMENGELYCNITCRDGFKATATSNKKTYHLDSTNKITLKHTCEPVQTQRTSSSATTEQNDTINVQLTILDEETDEPLIGASVIAIDTTGKKISRTIGVLGGATDSNGIVQIPNVPKNAMLEISYMGYATQKISPSASEKIKLTPNRTNMNEVEILATPPINKPCEQSTISYADATSGKITGTLDNLICEIQCPDDRTTNKLLESITVTTYLYNEEGDTYTLYDHCVCKDGTVEIDGKCTPKTNCSKDKNAIASEYDKEKKCVIKKCTDKFEPNDDGTACVKIPTKCPENQTVDNATKTSYDQEKRQCIALNCKCGFKVENGECVAWKKDTTTNKYTEPCTQDTKPSLQKNAKSATLQCDDKGKAFCEITACNDSYKHNEKTNTCDSLNKTPCTPSDKNATAGEYKTVDGQLVCIITACTSKFTPSKDGKKCVGKNILSKEDSLEKIDKLQKNADEMHKIEQSTANKALGAAGMGAVGIGGMQLLSAAAEQSADQDAEEAMRAYLATFHCNYGAGKNISGGTKNVELPGGNELIGLYSEYVNLANDLKIRKNALGLRPGIESEPILDSATSGLYDDVSIGKTTGAFTSLARALSDPNGPDAIAWAKQKADTADKLKTGATVAGIGIVGSIVGNAIINRNNPDEASRQINDEYDRKRKIFQDLEQEVAQLPAPTANCPSDANGTHPNCTCKSNKYIYNSNGNTCDKCPGDKINIDGKCDCQSPLVSGENDTCIMPQQSPQCAGDHMALDEKNNKCVCINGYIKTDDGKSCHCPTKTHHVEGENCVKNQETTTVVVTPVATEPIKINLPADSLFEFGKATLTDAAKSALDKFIQNMKNNGFQNCELQIDGYTDCSGSETFNQKLSENRANSVKEYLTQDNTSPISSKSIATGHGEGDCSCGAGEIPQGKEKDLDYKQCVGKYNNYTNSNNLRFAPCRKVTITVDANNCKSTNTNVNISILNPNNAINPLEIQSSSTTEKQKKK